MMLGCSNDPYPESDAGVKILYGAFSSPPKTLDPAVAYSTVDHMVTGNVYDTLLEYHYLKRPYTLIPGLAQAVPTPEEVPGESISYHFSLRDGVLFQRDPCFSISEPGRDMRKVVAADVAFALERIADPKVNSPVIMSFNKVQGFEDFTRRLERLRTEQPDFEALPIHEQYARAGGIEGIRVTGDTELTLVLTSPNPQILFWFAMPFTTPLPWEAIEYYDGQDGRPDFSEHPVGTGPFVLATYNKDFRIVLERNKDWYGVVHPEWHAPGATYPDEGEPEDRARGLLAQEYVGRPLPFIQRVELRLDKEDIPTFNKFLQGYYDVSGVIQESFDMVIRGDALSEEMAAQGMKLEKSIVPAIYYLGFNMEDNVVGAPAGDSGRKLRQAMSMAIDSRTFLERFMNGRGIPAQSPLPPGIFGYEEEYRNPYRIVDLKRAKEILAEAGYPGGVDPRTGQALKLSFDTYDTSSRGRARYLFFVDSWRSLGIDVEIVATDYNQFQEKVREGSYQLFMWGWVADYPDPENFLFLLQSAFARSVSGGPNTANFQNARFDELFHEMKDMSNGPERMAVIRAIRTILEEERPWIELFHPEDYALYHAWMRNVKPSGLSIPTAKYRDLDPVLRERWRKARNAPVRWPLYVALVLTIAVIVPGVRTYLRERQ